MNKFIKEKYIPEIVRNVLKKETPKSEQDFIDFFTALYEVVKKREISLQQGIDRNRN